MIKKLLSLAVFLSIVSLFQATAQENKEELEKEKTEKKA